MAVGTEKKTANQQLISLKILIIENFGAALIRRMRKEKWTRQEPSNSFERLCFLDIYL